MTTGVKRWPIAIGFGSVILLGIGTFVLAAATFDDRLKAPFGLKPRVNLAQISLSGDELLTQTKDTDRDGLPDVQELQVYKTSPFLEDSDSDGVLDKAEIEAGQDPNCPQGIDCRALAFPPASQVAQEQIARQLYEDTVLSKLDKTGVPGLTDPATVRAMLRQAGVPEEILAQFDNQALRGLLQQAASQSGIPVPTLTLPSPLGRGDGGEGRGDGGSPATTALPPNPTPAAIRDLLIKGGIDQKLLEKFNDAQLLKLYQYTLKGLQQ